MEMMQSVVQYHQTWLAEMLQAAVLRGEMFAALLQNVLKLLSEAS